MWEFRNEMCIFAIVLGRVCDVESFESLKIGFNYGFVEF